MIPAPANRAARQKASGQFGGTVGTATAQIEKGPPFAEGPIDSQNRSALRANMHDVIVRASVFVGPLERTPAGGECQAAVFADQIP